MTLNKMQTLGPLPARVKWHGGIAVKVNLPTVNACWLTQHIPATFERLKAKT